MLIYYTLIPQLHLPVCFLKFCWRHIKNAIALISASPPDHPANLDVLIQNFDCALSHPDANDLEKLKEAVMDPSF